MIETADTPAVDDGQKRFSFARSRVVEAVGGLSLRVRTKLLVAYVGTVVLLVVVGVLGLRVLSQSNSRVESLGALQLRASAYREIQTEVVQGRTLLGLRAGGADVSVYTGGTASSAPTGRSLVFLDQTILTAFAQVGPATQPDHLGVVPPAADAAVLAKIRADGTDLSNLMSRIIVLDQADDPANGNQLQSEAESLATDLRMSSTQLVNATQAETDALIADSHSSFLASRNLFIAVAVGSILLALFVGLVLSWSVIGPIQRIQAGLAAISSGDFSHHVTVANRDELGALGADINRMNDELGRLYREIETVSGRKSEFLADMSHELRTPLNAIIGFSEVLHEQMAGELNEVQMQYVRDVRDAGRHLLSLINDILDLSKIEAGYMELELSEVSIADAFERGLKMQSERAERNSVSLDMEMDPAIGMIEADERKVRQVVLNLLSNAMTHTPRGGRIQVSAHVADGVVEAYVSDTGPGIDPEDQERIFEEFQQARTNGGNRPSGTGLGLSLSRRFVELHGGRLWVESAPGLGSTFRFTLPVRQSSLA